MRKTITWLAVLLAVMLVIAGAMPWGLPADTLVSGPATQADGDVLVAENRDMVSRIYTLRGGQVAELYQEARFRNGAENDIVRIAADGEDTYFVRVFKNGDDWELLQLRDGSAVSLHQGTFEEKLTVTGLAAREGTVWVTGVGANGATFVYEYTEADGVKLKFLTPAWWLWDTATAEFDGEVIRATTEQGDHCFMTPGGEKTYDDAAAEAELPVVSAGGTAWILCKQSVFLAMFLVWLVIAVSVLIAASTLTRAGRVALRLTALGGEILFLCLLAIVGAVFFLVLRYDGFQIALYSAGISAAAGLLIWLVGWLVMWTLFNRTTKPLAAMTHQMEEVASGRVTMQEASSGKDELSRMDQAIQELCMSLSIRNYEMDATIRSYQRFVPDKLTDLLERANLAEVELGDNRRLVGNVGFFSVGNRAQARAMLEDAAFVDFINYSFGLFQDCVQENRGCMISSGLRLSAMETLFPDAASDGVRMGLEFLGQTQKKPLDGIPAPQPFLILHRTPLLYGVAGQEDRLYPYLSSSELEFLGSFAQQFHEAGVRIVATEAYWKQLKSNEFAGRYIGFVSDGDKGTYKLYEILDSCSELERKLRLGYDQRFQEAINLFYHNDFFLARNLFSTLLRVCPDDGIVRWYLFACEHFFNQDGDYEADYRLFGINESL